jgi:hypothetical protein
VLEAKRNFVRSIWPGVRKNYPKEVGDALVTAANNPTWSPQDVRGLWVKIQDHFRAERAK